MNKVIVFSTSYFPYAGGAEVAIREIAGRLTGNFDFFVITGRFSKTLPKQEVFKEGIVIRVGVGSKIDKFLLPFLGCIKAFLLLRKIKQTGQKSILWGMDISTGSVAASFLKLLIPSVSFVFTIQYGEGDERLRRGRMGMIGISFRWILARADFVTAISTYLFDVARAYGYNGPISMIHNGVDVEHFSKIPKAYLEKDMPIIITTSRLVEKNGIDTLIRSVAKIKREFPSVRLHILGEGPLKADLHFLVSKLGLENEVSFLGLVAHDKLPVALSRARIFVRSSRSEGMGNSFVEALAAGLPIVGTPVGGILDIIEDGKTGLFAKVNDPDDLARKIAILLRDTRYAEVLASEGRRKVGEQFSWNKIALEFKSVFENTLESLHILIATPLFPPQLGGPAFYAKNFREEFLRRGSQVCVASFGRYYSIPSGLRHFLYFLEVLRKGISADVIFLLDQFSAGFPVFLAAKILRKPYVLRLEGDFLWERYVERKRADITLVEFYRNPPVFTIVEKIIRKFTYLVIKSASLVVFSSEWRRDMIFDFYEISGEKTSIISNAWPAPKTSDLVSRKKIILWAGRFLHLKNLQRLIKAFSDCANESWELHLVGEGPEKSNIERFVKELNFSRVYLFSAMAHEELKKKMAQSEFFVLPSFSEVGPNIIADAIAVGLPFVMTKESGYAEYLKDYGVFFDPLLEMDIADKIKRLMDDRYREELRNRLKKFDKWREWKTAAEEWISVFHKIAG